MKFLTHLIPFKKLKAKSTKLKANKVFYKYMHSKAGTLERKKAIRKTSGLARFSYIFNF